MSSKVLKTGLVAAMTALLATSAFAQDRNWNRDRDGRGEGRRGDREVSVTKPVPPAVVHSPTSPSAMYWPGNNRTPGIDRRQHEQALEIEQGRRRGLLTEREAAQLRAEQARIAEMERRAKADGHVTRDERWQIRGAQQQAERHIQEEKYDRETDRGNRGWGHGWRRGWW